ncbi:hypothetical protein M406DRAFT_332397 [Cryphonectria parasitica EP155]|uniref:RING-type domain-containing protein n=1 Tax=Cryphonectria parasitica (strain ATCC 38755 / EP155) TaxID=660469 RepID=A0A9P4XZW7_CRYP1|nr:uncharacterized protein M406DRAFT_332397 [Cryphonectria parasitica EP155]KAF3763958.1 hypothetical protein M406DRAFT_332397 [Cryphonectria parasitica EP155]
MSQQQQSAAPVPNPSQGSETTAANLISDLRRRLDAHIEAGDPGVQAVAALVLGLPYFTSHCPGYNFILRQPRSFIDFCRIKTRLESPIPPYEWDDPRFVTAEEWSEDAIDIHHFIYVHLVTLGLVNDPSYRVLLRQPTQGLRTPLPGELTNAHFTPTFLSTMVDLMTSVSAPSPDCNVWGFEILGRQEALRQVAREMINPEMRFLRHPRVRRHVATLWNKIRRLDLFSPPESLVDEAEAVVLADPDRLSSVMDEAGFHVFAEIVRSDDPSDREAWHRFAGTEGYDDESLPDADDRVSPDGEDEDMPDNSASDSGTMSIDDEAELDVDVRRIEAVYARLWREAIELYRNNDIDPPSPTGTIADFIFQDIRDHAMQAGLTATDAIGFEEFGNVGMDDEPFPGFQGRSPSTSAATAQVDDGNDGGSAFDFDNECVFCTSQFLADGVNAADFPDHEPMRKLLCGHLVGAVCFAAYSRNERCPFCSTPTQQ